MLIAGPEPDSPPAPTCDDVEARFRALVDGADPGPISDWAMQWTDVSYAEVEDEFVWEALGTLAGCDIPYLEGVIGPPRLLYGHVDHVPWLEEFLAARAADEGGTA